MKKTISLDSAMFLIIGIQIQEIAIAREMLKEEPDIKKIVKESIEYIESKYNIEL